MPGGTAGASPLCANGMRPTISAPAIIRPANLFMELLLESCPMGLVFGPGGWLWRSSADEFYAADREQRLRAGGGSDSTANRCMRLTSSVGIGVARAVA